MTRTPKIWVAVTVALMAFAGIALAATGRERSLAVYPAQVMPIKFDHALHLENGSECVTCHDSARKSQKSSDLNLPGHSGDSKDLKPKAKFDAWHAECSDCHEMDPKKPGKKAKEGDPPASCDTCHAGFDYTAQTYPARVVFPEANLIFDHKVHVDKKIECKSCHGDMTDLKLATRQQLPKMETCLQCHDGKYAKAECTTCHIKAPSGRLQIAFASGSLRPMQGNPLGLDHGPRYEFNHGSRAAIARQECLACHTETYCATCHDSLQKPLSVHPNDFITLHPLEARSNSLQCESCHRYQSFCAACHERAGVGQSSDLNLRAGNVRVHPDYATWVVNLGPEHHGIAATRNLQQCIACHREESCLQCHAAGTVAGATRVVNPHPSDFKTKCRGMFQSNPTACLKCHLQGIEAQCL
ncbi:MAG: cytochrome c3 family protein [Myxococcaceae bacterium]